VGDNSCLVKDGENGFLAEKRDIDSLAHNLEILVMNKEMCQQFGKRSKEKLYNNYSLNTFRDSYIQTIKEL
jgi:glycosyltransferase involved in cell wall biosynthesis